MHLLLVTISGSLLESSPTLPPTTACKFNVERVIIPGKNGKFVKPQLTSAGWPYGPQTDFGCHSLYPHPNFDRSTFVPWHADTLSVEI
jgi:hypothetical protein